MVWTRIVDSISGRLAFFPPSPPSYAIETHCDGARELFLQPVPPWPTQGPPRPSSPHPIPGGRSDDVIVTAFVPAPSGVRFTLLCSHGNAVDLGQMVQLYDELSRILKVNIMSYDYRGYGLSSGVPAASSTLEDAAAALGYLLESYGRAPGDVVLYGQSVGTGPTSWLAARSPGVAGVVLHSPFTSGLRVIKPGLKRWPAWADIFPNFKYVPKIAARTLIMHGVNDEVIDVSHGRQLHELCKNPAEPLWAAGPIGTGHQDLEAHPSYLPTLRAFLTECFGEEYARQFRGGGR